MLFDDLPEAKKVRVNGVPTNQEDADPQQQQQQPSHAIGTEQPRGNAVSVDKKLKSLVDSLGNAGTKMAFLPAALRKRKAVGLPMNSIKSSSSQQQQQHQVRRQNSAIDTNSQAMAPSSVHGHGRGHGPLHMNMNMQADRSIHEDLNIIPKSQSHDDHDHDHDHDDKHAYREPQSLTDRHASIHSADMYNPMTPNDYLAYRQRKENELMQANLQKQAQKTLEMQTKLRDQIQDERLKALASGDFDKIVESRLKTDTDPLLGGGNARAGMGTGRGRGRGLSNLPAWLVKKQQESASKMER